MSEVSGGSPLQGFVVPEPFRKPGDADDTAALQHMFALPGGPHHFALTRHYLISETLTPPAGSTIDGYGIGRVTMTRPNKSGLNVSNINGVTIVNLAIDAVEGGASPYVAGVVLNRAQDCTVRNCNIAGFAWGGIFLSDASFNRVIDNRVGTLLGTSSNAADINLYYSSCDNIVSGNHCFGTRAFGINVQSPNGNPDYLPARNKIVGNKIGPHSIYGINVYIGGQVGGAIRNSNNLVAHNDIWGVTGLDLPSGGNGIYCVGNGLGGLQVLGNRVWNCCTNTLHRSNAPGGIGVTGFGNHVGEHGAVKPLVEGNSISGMTQGDGIIVNNCPAGVSLGTNNVEVPGTNNGTGPGGAELLGSALRIQASSQVVVAGGSYTNLGKGDAMLLFASSGDMASILASGVFVRAASAYAVRAAQQPGYSISNLNIANVSGESGGAAFQMIGLKRSSVSGMNIVSASEYAADVRDCTMTVFNGCHLAGTYALTTSGNCSGTRFDQGNNFAGAIENGGSGCVVVHYAAAPPKTGLAQVGDIIINVSPVADAPDRWRCVASGGTGKWQAIGDSNANTKNLTPPA